MRRFLRAQEGANMAEYALIAALVAVACITAFTNLGQAITNKLQEIQNALES